MIMPMARYRQRQVRAQGPRDGELGRLKMDGESNVIVDIVVFVVGVILVMFGMSRIDRALGWPPASLTPDDLRSRDGFPPGSDELLNRRILALARVWPLYLFAVLHLFSRELLPTTSFGASLLWPLACAAASLAVYTYTRWRV
jgi:hypothetical protein